MRRLSMLLAMVIVLASGTYGSSGLVPVRAWSHAPSVDSKKKCHTVTKTVHGKKKRVKVCKTVHPRSTPTNTPPPTPTPTPTPAPTSQPAHQLRQAPAFAGVASGGFIAGLSTRVTLPPSTQRSWLRDQQTGTGQPIAGGTNLTPIDFNQVSLGSNGSMGFNLKNLTVTVADGRGFYRDQDVCVGFADGSSFVRLICSPLAADPVPKSQPGLPDAATLTLKDVAVDAHTFDLIRQHADPGKAIIICDNLGVPIELGEQIGPGDLLELFFSPGSLASAKVYRGVVSQVDAANHIAYVPGLEAFLPNLDPTNPNFAATALPPGTQITDLGSFQIGTLDLTRYRINVQIPSQAPGVPAYSGFTLFGYGVPSGSTTANPNLLVDNGGAGGLTETTVKGNLTPGGKVEVDVGGPGTIEQPLLVPRGSSGAQTALLGPDGKPELAMHMSFVAGPQEPGVGPIWAEFYQDYYSTYYHVTSTGSLDPAVDVCGVVSNYMPATADTPGSITVDGNTFPILKGTPLSDDNLIHSGANICLRAVLTASGQIIRGSVKANVSNYKGVWKDYAEPYDFNGLPLQYDWSFIPIAGDPDGVTCGLYAPAWYTSSPAFWSWYHPGKEIDPKNNCPHFPPPSDQFHHGIIQVVVTETYFVCTVKYPYGSRGEDPTDIHMFGPSPTAQDCVAR